MTGSKSDWGPKRPSGGHSPVPDAARRTRPSGRPVELVPGLTMSKSAFAGFCLTAFAGGVVATVLVDRISGRSRASASRSGDEGAPMAPAPLTRPAVVPEFQALPPSAPRKGGIEIEPVLDRASVAARATDEKQTRSASPSAKEPARPQRAAARGRASGSRKVAASGGTSAAKGGDDTETRSQGGGWTDPFAE